MSSGLPTALPPFSVTRNFSRAVHVVAATCLAGAALIMLAFQVYYPDRLFWPALAALVPISGALLLVDRYRDAAFTLLYLLGGAASVYTFTLVVADAADASVLARTVTFELPKVALIMVGGVGSGAASSLRWCTTGFVVGEIAYSAALLQLGVPWRFDPVTAGAFVVVAMLLAFAWFNRRRANRTRPRFTSAARDELVAALRYRIELRAAAMLHDTVLSHLAAVAVAPGDRLDPLLAQLIRADLARLTDEDWLVASPPAPPVDDDRWRSSPVHAAVRDARATGLEVGVTGDTAAPTRLSADRAFEVGLAVRQCLANVLQHSGTRDAEVALYGGEHEVLIMVVDSGIGFDESRNAADRLGVRHSIRGRVESIGGTVQIWSTPGRGTSVVLRVPTDDAASPDAVGQRVGESS